MRSKIQRDNLLDLLRNYIHKLNIGQIIIGVVIVALSIWCLINVRVIMQQYYEYETIITLKNQQPTATEFPGITVCAPSIFTPQKLAELYPEFNKSLTAFIKLRRDDEKFSDVLFFYNMTTWYARYSELLKYESMAMEQFTASEIIKKYSVQPEEILGSCIYHPVNIRNFQINHRQNQHVVINATDCLTIQPVLQSIYENRKCFTIFSDLVKMKKQFHLKNTQFYSDLGDHSKFKESVQQTAKNCTSPNICTHKSSQAEKKKWSQKFEKLLDGTNTQMVFDLNPSIELQIKPLDSTPYFSYVLEPIKMTVHPPNILMNRRDFMFFQVQKSSYFEIQVTKKITHLLEPPFKTWCVNYTENNEYIKKNVRTRDHCISYCINHSKTLDCANYFSVLIDSMFVDDLQEKKICSHGKQNYNKFLQYRAECEQNCNEDCKKVIIEIIGQAQNLYDTFCPSWFEVNTLEEGLNDNDSEAAFDYQTRSLGMSKLNPFRPIRVFEAPKWEKSFKSIENKVGLESYSSYFSTVKRKKFQAYNSEPSRCNAKVTIKLAPKPFVTVQHQQAISYENMLGSIGGHLGIWLSLSLYKIIKFIVHILYNLLHKLVRKFSPSFLIQTPTPRH